MVFYRKYRPQTINELDSASLRETLTSLLQQNTPHAFLFTGPKGLGKTSTARIIAKVVNCNTNYELRIKNQEEKKHLSIEPCNECSQCLSTTNGTNLDVIEIDAASNRGIDEIRDLKEKIRLSPVSAKKKIYIIDEVHMLTTEAFNALLKTLEEPPAHALFILCTTEAHKIPATILSRCFHLSFQPATTEELVRSFSRIVKSEKIAITEDALEYIAQMSDRGFRDGVKILEEMVALAGGKEINRELINAINKSVNVSVIAQVFLNALVDKNAKEAILQIKGLTDQGTDIKYFINYIIDSLHKILLLKLGITEEFKNLFSQQFSISEIKILTELFSKASLDMKFAVLPQLPLELAIIAWCQTEEGAPDKSIQPEAPSEKLISSSDTGVTVSSLRKHVGALTAKKVLYGDDGSDKKPEKKPDAEAHVALLHTSPQGSVTKEWQDALWRGLLDELKKHNHTIAGVLRSCTIGKYDRRELIIETAYTFHKERLDDPKVKDILTRACKLLTGKDVSVRVELRK